ELLARHYFPPCSVRLPYALLAVKAPTLVTATIVNSEPASWPAPHSAPATRIAVIATLHFRQPRIVTVGIRVPRSGHAPVRRRRSRLCPACAPCWSGEDRAYPSGGRARAACQP